MDTDEIMLVLQALDPNATVGYSSYTRQWYVQANISIGNGAILTGATEHRSTPGDAVAAFFNRVADLSLDEYVVSDYLGHRREWRWNGAAFAECTRDEVFSQEWANEARKRDDAMARP